MVKNVDQQDSSRAAVNEQVLRRLCGSSTTSEHDQEASVKYPVSADALLLDVDCVCCVGVVQCAVKDYNGQLYATRPDDLPRRYTMDSENDLVEPSRFLT